MIRNLLLCDVSLVGVIGVAAPANADQYDFISYLDNNGVYYDSISDMMDLGKAVCTSTRRTGALIWQSTGSSPPVTTPMLSAAQS